MEEELNLSDYIKIIYKRRKMIIILTLLIVLVGGVYSLVKPKLYESESMIQLAVLPILDKDGVMSDSKFIFSPEEAKHIIESSIILDPVINSFFKEGKRPSVDTFVKKFLEVDMVYEEIGNQKFIPPFLTIKVKAYDSQVSKNMVLAITNRWMDYINVEFDTQKDVLISRYNNTEQYKRWDDFNFMKYNTSIAYATKRMEEVRSNIKQYTSDILALESDINSVPESSLSGESIAKTSLLMSVLSNYKDRLSNEQETLATLEEDINTKNMNYEETILWAVQDREKSQKTLSELLLYARSPEIINYPQEPTYAANSDIKKEMIISFGAGLLISILLAFMIEWSKDIKPRK